MKCDVGEINPLSILFQGLNLERKMIKKVKAKTTRKKVRTIAMKERFMIFFLFGFKRRRNTCNLNMNYKQGRIASFPHLSWRAGCGDKHHSRS